MQQLVRAGIEGDGRPVNLPARRSGPAAGDRSRSVVSSNDRPVGHNQETARCNAVPYQRLAARLGVAHPAKPTIACDATQPTERRPRPGIPYCSMLMVIFGAGASYDSLVDISVGYPDKDLRPPLANQLFGRRGVFEAAVQEYGECRPIIPQLRQLTQDTNLEKVLEALRAEGEYDDQRHVQLHAVRYYLRNVIEVCSNLWPAETRGVTNYSNLLDRIRNWCVRSREPVAFVTFNYDTMLEAACSDVYGFVPTNIHSYISRDDFQVFKPHGSINWVRAVAGNVGMLETANQSQIAHALIRQGKKLDLLPGQHLVSSGDPGILEGHYTYPAIALPVETKNEFEFPDAHLKKLRDVIPEVTRVLIIGWRGTEEHFLKLWLESGPPPVNRMWLESGGWRGNRKVLVVSGSPTEAQQVTARLGVPLQGQFVNAPGGFSWLVTSGASELHKLLAD